MTTHDLERLGAALHAAASDDFTRAARRRHRRTLAGALAALAIALPGAALAADALISNDEVAKSIPSGTWALMGTHPTCTTVRPGVEFDCRLVQPPRTGDVAPGGWDGTVEPTVDRSKHVNGGCRSQSADGMRWRCYIGPEAVRQSIIGAGFLGEYAPAPGRG
jgi:hypothetical protein